MSLVLVDLPLRSGAAGAAAPATLRSATDAGSSCGRLNAAVPPGHPAGEAYAHPEQSVQLSDRRAPTTEPEGHVDLGNHTAPIRSIAATIIFGPIAVAGRYVMCTVGLSMSHTMVPTRR